MIDEEEMLNEEEAHSLIFGELQKLRLNKRAIKYTSKLIDKFWRGERLDNLQLRNALCMVGNLSIRYKKKYACDIYFQIRKEYQNRFNEASTETIEFLKKQGFLEINPDFNYKLSKRISKYSDIEYAIGFFPDEVEKSL